MKLILLAIVSFVASTSCNPEHQVLPILAVRDGILYPNTANLQFIFGQVPRNTPVAVLSIAGELRKGKSFVLNFFLQYLQQRSEQGNVTVINDQEDLEQMIESGSHPWLRDVDKNSGFYFIAGNKRDTVGVTMWSQPFLITKSDGTKQAVVLMDSQGLYDPATTPNDNVRIFTMVALLSSSLMLNTPQNINLNQLSELKYFTDYASLQSEVSMNAKNFQRLTFLIRDYSLGEEYGWHAGQQVLDYYMKPSDGQSNVTKTLARVLKQAFESIDAFALPFPGSQVTSKKFDGRLDKIDIQFLLHLQDVVSNLVEKSEARKRLGMDLMAGDMYAYVQQIADIFNNQLPPDEIMKLNERQVTMRAYNETQMHVEEYRNRMQAMFPNNDSFFLNLTDIDLQEAVQEMHEATSASVLNSFSMNGYSGFFTHTSVNGSVVSAQQWLKNQISDQFEAISPRLISIAKERIAIAKFKQQAEEERRRLTHEQERLSMENSEKEAEVKLLEEQAVQNRMERERIEKQRQEADEKVKLQEESISRMAEQAVRDQKERERLGMQQAEMEQAQRQQQRVIAQMQQQAESDRKEREKLEQERQLLDAKHQQQQQSLNEQLSSLKAQQAANDELREKMHRLEVEQARQEAANDRAAQGGFFSFLEKLAPLIITGMASG